MLARHSADVEADVALSRSSFGSTQFNTSRYADQFRHLGRSMGEVGAGVLLLT